MTVPTLMVALYIRSPFFVGIFLSWGCPRNVLRRGPAIEGVCHRYKNFWRIRVGGFIFGSWDVHGYLDDFPCLSNEWGFREGEESQGTNIIFAYDVLKFNLTKVPCFPIDLPWNSRRAWTKCDTHLFNYILSFIHSFKETCTCPI